MEIDFEKARREELRWLILLAAYAGQPVGASEAIVLSAIQPVVPDLTLAELRKELDYLDERKLITVSQKRTPCWFVKINNHGIDCVEYTTDCYPGIARPPKWC